MSLRPQSTWRPRITRRSLLSGIGAGTAALIARPLVRDCFAQAAPPKRLLIMYMPNCSIRANWLPAGGRTPLTNQGDARQFTLNMGSQPLEPARPYMTMVTGLDLKNIVGCNHGSAIIRLMSGGGIRPVLPTIDQVLAQQAAALQGTPIPSLQLGTDTRADPGSNGIQLRVMSYDADSPLPPEIEPVKTYTRIFSSLMPVTDDAAAKQAMARTLAEERSVLDFVRGDLERLDSRLPAAEREKLAKHTDGLREIERSLAPRADVAGAPRTLPGPPEAVTPNVSANHKKVIDQYLALIKLAFEFDITRVITFMFASGNNTVSLGDFMPGYAVGAIHRIAHAYKPIPLTQATRWYTGITAAFINELAAIKEVDGSSLLDHTLVPFFSEVGQYHEHNDVPFALFGGSTLGHTGGRCLTYPGRTPNDVWVGVARAFGVELGTFGDKALNAGPLPELLG
jgi:hypothetical protein